jgi:predicted O-methyltransferase YrrM
LQDQHIDGFLSVIGMDYLKSMLDDGLPARLRLPLLFLLTKSLSQENQLAVDRIEAVRSKMADRDDVRVAIYPSPSPGSVAELASPEERPEPGELKTVRLNLIANTASALSYWGAFLYLCAYANRAKTISELGGCAGISGCYMASSEYCKQFITIEGSPELAMLAETNIRQVANNFLVVKALFDDGLDKILPTLKDGLDVVYIDGQHEKIAAFHYLERLARHLNTECILVFDEICWTCDMWKAWQTICKGSGLAWTMDVGRYGICMWDGTTTKPKNYDFSKFTDL